MQSPPKIIAGNWKMNLSLDQAQSLASEVIHMVQDKPLKGVLCVMAPPFPYLRAVNSLIPKELKERVHVAAQDCHQEDFGAFTGDVSAPMIKSLGVNWVILGHSERRTHHGETGAVIQKKLTSARNNNLSVIYCVGENLQERETGQHLKTVERQILEVLDGRKEENGSPAQAVPELVIAYEPVWAIGTGKVAMPQQAREMHTHIRSCLGRIWAAERAKRTAILYGGSCKPDNAAEIFAMPDVDGGLIGGASLKSRDFIQLMKLLHRAGTGVEQQS